MHTACSHPYCAAVAASLTLLTLLALPQHSSAHGFLAVPNQRGTLRKREVNPNAPNIDSNAPIDFLAHFPSGNKNPLPGAGRSSQALAARPEGWTPFTPLQKNFKWRTGVCGDEKGKTQHHLKGGKYFYNGKIVATYKQGSQMRAEVNIFAHHNGFIEFHVCDVSKCGGDISEDCFRRGHCWQLQRSKNPLCDTRTNKKCAPIDPNYPGRWYLPCSSFWPEQGKLEIYGGQTMLYDLPPNLHCDRCVLHWFWSSANHCNPPGVREFFDGSRSPKWGTCRGQAGAIGGVTRVQQTCSSNKNPEEYYQCADIKILRKGTRGNRSVARVSISPIQTQTSVQSPVQNSTPKHKSRPSPEPSDMAKPSRKPEMSTLGGKRPPVTKTPSLLTNPSSSPTATVSLSHSPVASSKRSYGMDSGTGGGSKGAALSKHGEVIKDIMLVADGKKIRTIRDGERVDVGKYEKIAIEALTTKTVDKVTFFVNGNRVWTDLWKPYFMFGNIGNVPNYWKTPIINEEFELMIVAGKDTYKLRMTFRKYLSV